MLRSCVLVTGLALALFGATPRSEQGPVVRVGSLPIAGERPGFICGTPAESRPGLRPLSPLAANSPLAYDHFPRILTPNEAGTIRVVAEVVGDVPAVVFRRNVPSLPTGYVSENWSRATTRSVGGRLVSVFDQSYPGSILADLLLYPHGHDFPQVPLGRLEVPGSGVTDPNGTLSSPSFVTVWLKVAPASLPASIVGLVNSSASSGPVAQYASHVVNLVLPGFGDARMSNGGQAFEFKRAAAAFYRHFADVYHTLSFVPRRSPFGYAAFNINVTNDVRGIGSALFNEQAAYGSRMLRSVQLYAAGFPGQHETTVHQIAHQWGDETNLAGIAGAVAAGYQPARHSPLLQGGTTLIGAVLKGTREVERVPSTVVGGTDTFQIKRTTAPITFHPLQLYRMGFLEPAAIPDVTVFADQAQLGGAPPSAPTVTTPVVGVRKSVDINEIMAALGPRSGPSFSEWRVAFVVVSEEPVSKREMDYYNFYAQRAAVAAGTRSYDGFGSFSEATGNRTILRTNVDPLDPGVTQKIAQTLAVGYPSFGVRDWRGLVFDTVVPSRVQSGSTLVLTGRIDQEILTGNYRFLVLRVARYGALPSAATTVQTTVRGGRFVVPLSLVQPGAYAIDAFVFVDADGPAIPTSVLTPLFVE